MDPGLKKINELKAKIEQKKQNAKSATGFYKISLERKFGNQKEYKTSKGPNIHKNFLDLNIVYE